MLWRMTAEPRLDRIGSMLARPDNLPQRHCWVTRRVAAPDVDFRTSMRWGRMRRRDDPCSRNSPSRACHAKLLAIGIPLAEIAQSAAMARPSGIATETGVVRKGRKPIFLLYRYESIPVGPLGGKMARQADSSSAVWRANGNCRTWFLWCPLTQGRRGEAPRAIKKFPIFSMRESHRPPPMVLTYSGLLRPKVLIVMRKSACSRLKVSLEDMLESFTRHTSGTVTLAV